MVRILLTMVGKKEKGKNSVKGDGRGRSRTPSRCVGSEATVDANNSKRGKRKATGESEIRPKEPKKVKTTTQVEFVEDDQVVQLSARGQDSDFVSDGEEDESLGEEQDRDDQFVDSSGEAGNSRNNNATVNRNEVVARQGIDQHERDQIIGEAIGQAVAKVQDFMNKSGFIETANFLRKQMEKQEKQNAEKEGTKEGEQHKEDRIRDKTGLISNSEITIYKNAVLDGTKNSNNTQNRISTSSEEGGGDTSDENLAELMEETSIDPHPFIDQIQTQGEVAPLSEPQVRIIHDFIAEQRQKDDRRRGSGGIIVDEQRPSTSRDGPRFSQGNHQSTDEQRASEREAEQKALDMIRQAEAAKAKIYETPGGCNADMNVHLVNKPQAKLEYDFDLCKDYVHSAMVDEHYLMVGGHIDDSLKAKIGKGEYIDFAKLLTRDRILDEEEETYRMVFKGGKQFWAPQASNVIIGGFSKWEQAFRVYSNIYIKAHPHRATELVQYNHLIHTASLEFVWSNVYNYDRDFRLHLASFPNRSWAIILQQAWTLRLKERLRMENRFDNRNPGNQNHSYQNRYESGWGNNSNGRDRSCGRFQKGRCSYGASCKFEHRCKYCGKWGHGTSVCRKLKADKGENSSSGVPNVPPQNDKREDKEKP